ncbi:hypothetical protein SCHPADRAFT_276940 [Schizopora paradoxa]|uniref:Uncharacterized protein n=1 Tax=Schizopora paradoxa TaxID=27342 RepID=A0A0H2RT37_9AGAM|nr:hypothetical protein SCHPADRAFT_276940 [Schizopora paradoxa]
MPSPEQCDLYAVKVPASTHFDTISVKANHDSHHGFHEIGATLRPPFIDSFSSILISYSPKKIEDILSHIGILKTFVPRSMRVAFVQFGRSCC